MAPTGASAAVRLALELACGGDTNDFLSPAELPVSAVELLASRLTGTRRAPPRLPLASLMLEWLTPAWRL